VAACGGVTGFVGNLSNGLILIVAEEEDDPLAMSFANGRQRRSEGKSRIPEMIRTEALAPSIVPKKRSSVCILADPICDEVPRGS